ncbi:hypothetical protein JR316_0005478 [Psilocybe cubensis]|uniref:Uncharacterized protein n=1 Tax=Psilocybe cubensis TaxID=181762 RepID=A0ACB8H6V4_PSICU|nr:hypothetical protein JR316_0005478 [Psilocybe cubensis]KAH9483372.1 hypothetical protein JR316_0005478 [Psilocybe cubensis]
MAFIANHVYTIANKTQFQGNNMMIGLLQAKPDNGTPCQVFIQASNEETFNQQWLIKEVAGKQQVYTFQDIRTGSYLDLSNGGAANGTRVQGWNHAIGTAWSPNMQWKIVKDGNYMKIQNVASGTYLDLLSSPTTQAQNHNLNRYLVLPKSVRDAIYVKSGLKNVKGRGQLFDSDDYAFVLKAEVAKWGIATLLADDFGILWGVMFGEQGSRGLAYNFYLNENLDNVIFFDPYTGEEKVDMQYKAYFAVF